MTLVNADTMCQAGLQPAIQDRTLGHGITQPLKAVIYCKVAVECDGTLRHKDMLRYRPIITP